MKDGIFENAMYLDHFLDMQVWSSGSSPRIVLVCLVRCEARDFLLLLCFHVADLICTRENGTGIGTGTGTGT